MAEKLRISYSDPADQVRVLTSLARFTEPFGYLGTSSLSIAIQSAAQIAAALCRRAVLASLARGVALWTPASSTEAVSALQSLVVLYDAEIQYAADQGDAETFNQLRTLRTAVVTDLETRSATLPELTTVTLPQAIPATVIAQFLYQDAKREQEIVARNNPVHPLFTGPIIEVLTA